MKILAFEQSTSQASLAISENDKIIGSAKWDASLRGSDDLFTTLAPVLKDKNISLNEIDVFASSLGPGSFTGIRIALTTAKTMALPGDKQIFAVSTGEVLAYTSNRESVGVIGDARRNRLWGATFKRNNDTGLYEAIVNYDLFSIEETDNFFKECEQIVSTDFSRLEAVIGDLDINEKIIHENLVPTAETLCDIVYKKINLSIESDKLEPVYLHPAVFTKPNTKV
ncbi:MAG: tRNA (adenosine(37)-N6)-threonylcarbamoyltransferase complex dimerization subunit type 1 TsaB [Kiritimatiellae bacterium]|jgi:tRNA threonylcarbamoyladenosine biosynthesis protein TsaB|nr:tRNA (adenosine(37)-N6)-threonylcarbamoyltransferase complex dimerization subunit type 1 TsaB [Kiritimatiellia bacterium]